MASPLDRDKLGKVLALLTSDQPGEVVAAANRAAAMLRAADMTFSDLLTPASSRRGVDAAGYADGLREGHAKGLRTATQELKAVYRNAFNEGRRAGRQDAAEKAEQPSRDAINAAYARGFADGKAGVDLYQKPKPLRRKRSAPKDAACAPCNS